MDRRTLITAGLASAAGAAVGHELAAAPDVGAAADVDRSEFDALKARVAYLEQFHPPMPTTTTTPPHVPKFSGDVSLPAGFTVPFGEVWDFDPNVSTTVTVAANVVVAGTLRMRPANAGVVHTLRFVDVNESLFIGGGMEPLATDVGLWVIGAGVLDAVGTAKTSWARAAGAIAAGTSSVTLAAAPSGWQQGDTIIITPTVNSEISNFHDRYDTLTVQSLTGATVNTTANTVNPHPAVTVGDGFTVTAEVANLTRNVRIEGTPGKRAHVFYVSTAKPDIRHVEFAHLGPRKSNGLGHTGRYALHFHMLGDASRGGQVVGCVGHDIGNHVFVAHESHGITFDRCVSHNTIDEAFWWDPPTANNPIRTHDTVWSRCLASKVLAGAGQQGYNLAGFSLGAGDRNTITDCVAVGVQGFSRSAGITWPDTSQSPWIFARNVTHNNAIHGMFIWQNTWAEHIVNDFVAYHHAGWGIAHGAYVNGYRFRNGWLFGNRAGSVRLSAVSNENLPVEFDRIVCTGNGLHRHAIGIEHHAVAQPGPPVLVTGCTFVGHTAEAIGTVAQNLSVRELIDVVECGPTVPAIKLSPTVTAADSVVRVQNGTTATRYTRTGSESTAPFSSYVATPAQPFTVLAAA
jgi:hypothetical protein